MSAIKLNDRKTVYLTEVAHSVKNGSKKAGDAISIHPKQADAWISAGKATAEAPKKASK